MAILKRKEICWGQKNVFEKNENNRSQENPQNRIWKIREMSKYLKCCLLQFINWMVPSLHRPCFWLLFDNLYLWAIVADPEPNPNPEKKKKEKNGNGNGSYLSDKRKDNTVTGISSITCIKIRISLSRTE